MANLNPVQQFEMLKRNTEEAVRAYFPIDGKLHSLRLISLEWRDNLSPDDVHSQKEARLSRQTWGVPLYADIELYDLKANKSLDRKRVTLLRMPKMTREYSFLVRGQGRYVQNQFRLKSGVYTKRRQNGQLTSQFNLKEGIGFNIELEPNGHLMLAYPSANGSRKNIPLYSVLKTLGVSDEKMASMWGGMPVVEVNKKKAKNTLSDVTKLFETMWKRKPTDLEDAKRGILDAWNKTELFGDTTQKTLGTPVTKVGEDSLLLASKKLYNVAREEDNTDNLEDLGFKEIWSVEDHIPEKIKNSKREILRRILNNLDNKDQVNQIIQPNIFHLPVQAFFTMDTRCTLGDQTNPLTMLSDHRQTTLMGSGGLSSDEQITLDNTAIDPTHMGFLDPTHTPESSKTGVVQHLSMGAQKVGRELQTRVYNIQTKAFEMVTPLKLHQNTKVVGPDQVDWDGQVPKPKKPIVWGFDNGERKQFAYASANYLIPRAGGTVGPIAAATPFMSHTHGARVMMAARQVSQAIPVTDAEIPLVQTSNSSTDVPFEKMMGSFAAHTSPADGTITEIKDAKIKIKGTNGTEHTVQLYDHYPLNDKKSGVFYHSTPTVKVGDVVKRGSVIADTNYTKNGTLALGKNLFTAYLPSGGENFEDGVVISESAAKKLSSVHLYPLSLEMDEQIKLDRKDYLRYYGVSLTQSQIDKLDQEGIVKKGQILVQGDIVFAALKKAQANTLSESLRKMKKVLFYPYDDYAKVWENSHKGEVVDVVKRGKYVTVYVKTTEPMREGDKLTARHGNKGIVTRVRPDEEMPRTKDGRVVEVLMSPCTVPTRVNLGQLYEIAVSKIAEKTGKPYVSPYFSGVENHAEKVLKEMKEHGVSPTEELFDAKGRSFGQIGVGPEYIVKLKHMVEKKTAVAGRDAYDINESPKRGGHESAQKLDQYGTYALLAHGSRDLLREKFTYTANRNDKLWEAIENGLPIPPPQQTFAFRKFQGFLKAMGVNMEKRGHQLKLVPFTDTQIKEMSAGEIKKPWLQLFGDKEEVGGLFDRHLTGGLAGTKWSHIDLAEPIPNPLLFQGIPALLGLKKQDVLKVAIGEAGLKDGKLTDDPKQGGGKVLFEALANLDIPKELDKAKKALGNAKTAEIGPLRQKVKYLQALQEEKLPATVYMLKTLPVMPPTFRPVMATDDNSPFRSSVNGLYKYVGLTNHELKTLNPLMPHENRVKLRRALVGQTWKLFGAELRPYKDDRSIIPKDDEDVLGILESIAGTNPKSGFYQDKVISKRQYPSARSTITVGSDLGIDEVGIPRKSALKMFESFVKLELKKRGMTQKAQELIDKGDPQAYAALDHVLHKKNNEGVQDFHPVILKRDPALHAFSVMAFKPVLVEGDAIRLHPLSCDGFNADFDGDQQISVVFFVTSVDKVNADVCNVSHIHRVGETMSARIRETVVGLNQNDEIFFCDLEEFPRFDETGRVAHDDALFFEVPDGIRVFAFDENTNNVVLAPVRWWSVHSNKRVEIVTLRSGKQIITDDDDRAVYGLNPDTMSFERRRPFESNGLFVPVGHHIELEESVFSLPLPENKRLKGEMILDEPAGYLFGLLVGDGWLVHHHGELQGQISFAVTDPGIARGLADALLSCFHETPTLTKRETRDGLLPGSKGSASLTVSCMSFARFVNCVGSGAANKHLPPFSFSAPEPFKRGLLAGLLDTDGTVNYVKAQSKEKGQWQMSYQSNSLRLVREIKLLAQSLGVSSTITATQTPAGGNAWRLTFSSVEMFWLGTLPLCGDKRSRFDAFLDSPPPSVKGAYSRFDIIPISAQLAEHLRKHLQQNRNLTPSQNVVLSNAVERNYLSRETAMELLRQKGNEFTHRHIKMFERMVFNHAVRWDAVESVEKTNQVETGYDLTVPGYETFLSADGLILSNTMAAFVPVTPSGIEDAKKLLPSKKLFSLTNAEPMYKPSQDGLLGLYHMVHWGEDKGKKFNTTSEVIHLLHEKKIHPQEVITIQGQKTTPGRVLLDSFLPVPMRGGPLLRDPAFVMNKSTMRTLLKDVARNYKQDFPHVVEDFLKTGNHAAYAYGRTVSLLDLKPIAKERDTILSKAQSDIAKLSPKMNALERKEKSIDIYNKATQEISKTMKDTLKHSDNNLFHMSVSGARGSEGQVRQMLAAPMLVQDSNSNTREVPITKSYSEGLDFASYWDTQHGARKGIVQRASGTADPGAMSKKIINTTMHLLITEEDCRTTKGEAYKADDKHALGRVLLKPLKAGTHSFHAGEFYTEDVRKWVTKDDPTAMVAVRTPLHCEAHDGLCAKCFGQNSHGHLFPLGTNVGVIAGQALGEPLSQSSMDAFHEGGIAQGRGAQSVSKFQRATQLITFPQTVPGSAVLSEVDGEVTSIEKDPTGGNRVRVGDRDHKVITPLLVKKGDHVHRGQALSEGALNPHHLMSLHGPTKGLERVRSYITNELSTLFDVNPYHRKNIEVVVRALTNISQINDPGKANGVLRGDHVSTSLVKKMNEEGAEIHATPVLKGANVLPLLQTEDFLARANYEKIKETFTDAALQGWKSNIHGSHPIPSLVWGTEFGKGTKASDY